MQLGTGLFLKQRNLGAGIAAAVPEIWLGWGDSLGVGIDAADRAIDTYGTNVWQVRQRAPTGISNVTVLPPLDVSFPPDGIDHLSPLESFANQRAITIGAPVYLVPHYHNGSKFIASGWGTGNTLHEAAIARFNAAIQTVKTAFPTAVVGGMVILEGTNDSTANTVDTTWETAMTGAIANMRSRVFKNGISGADISTLPVILGGQMPEGMSSSTTSLAIELKMRKIAATITNGKYYKMPEGIARTDNIHPSVAGNRIVGPGFAALLTDKTAPVITPALAAYTQFAGQNMLIELTADKFIAQWVLSNTTDYELVSITDNVNGIAYSRVRWFLRWISDGTKTAGTYSTNITATDGAGNVSTITRTDTVLAAYGTQVSTPTATHVMSFNGATTNDARARSNVPISLGAGMNLLIVTRDGGSAPDFTAKFNGIIPAVDAGSNGDTKLLYLPSAVAQSGILQVTPTSSALTAIDVQILCLTGTVATPASSSVMVNLSRTTPHLTASLTCPSGGIIAGGGIVPGMAAPTPANQPSGQTVLFDVNQRLTAYRVTTGQLGAGGTNNGFSSLGAAAFAPA
jgi:hypothetical protein